MSKYLLLLSCLFVLIISCSDKSISTDDPPLEPLVYQFSDYIHFDTNDLYLIANTKDGRSYFPELYVYWEQVVGEPFTDLNGNGVYDVGIDIFIKSRDSTNMDLNHDGIHNGPDSPWQPGIPFDDINGDGLYQHNEYSIYSDYYTLGRPYFDFNNNDKWDAITKYDCAVVKCNLSIQDSVQRISFEEIDSVFLFVSDSNLTYYIPYTYYEYGPLEFVLVDSASFGLQSSSRDENRIELLSDMNEIISDSSYNQYGFQFSYFTDSIFKEIILGAELEYKDTIYTDLLHFRYSCYDWREARDVSLEIYFAKDIGLIAFYDYHFIDRSEDSKIYFIDRTETVPIMLTR